MAEMAPFRFASIGNDEFIHKLFHLVALYRRTLSNRNKVRKFQLILTKPAISFFKNTSPFASRNFGVGLSSFIARIGGSGSTAIVYLASIHSSVPFFTFSGMCLAAGSVLFFLPDTGDKPLPSTMREIEQRELDARDKKHVTF